MHIVGQQPVHGVPTHAARQPQHLVGHGAHLEAHAGPLGALRQVRVPRERETVPDAPRPEQQRVQQVVFVVVVKRLAAVQQQGDLADARGAAGLPEGEELGRKGTQGLAAAFFADEVEACGERMSC